MYYPVTWILAQCVAVTQSFWRKREFMSHKATNFKLWLCFSAIMLVSTLALLIPSTISRGQEPQLQSVRVQLPPERVQLLSGVPMQIAANEQNVSMVAGKDLSRSVIGLNGEINGRVNEMRRGHGERRGHGGKDKSGKARLNDVEIGDNPTIDENQPTVASNPENRSNLVAGSRFASSQTITRCVAYRSTDNGATWSSPFRMPLLSASSACADPVVAMLRMAAGYFLRIWTSSRITTGTFWSATQTMMG